ncbi:cyclic nucleotide-binding domain-containing protein [Terasakiella sp. A23]|uniref:Crp/Fnr family transcriptional regulator n=1 Tax=Terasakiella sp. FCG-A23 TaxID=3080561 RepID=UPI0029548002|nr:cyclic nucleotide-binding domain-containing protein [Terasakiella sp. A23]MDV7339568.1 cyclic nucleotide-binding domain-containing protein [Terasakiella sp. A23]
MILEAFEKAFVELSKPEIELLAEKSRDYIYQDGAKLMQEGEDHRQIMVIIDGEVRVVVRKDEDGKETELTTPLTSGATVGEMSFVDHGGASATLVAKGGVVVQAIDHELVQELANKDATFLQRFYHSLLITVIQRLRLLDIKMSYMG